MLSFINAPVALNNFKMGIGKCRLLNGAKTTGYKKTQDPAPNAGSCAEDCIKDASCTAFHFFKTGFKAPAGKCYTWTTFGLSPTGDTSSECYIKY